MHSCQQAAVLGSGVMGSGIAAHLAGAGIRTHLLDIVPQAGAGAPAPARNALAQGGLERALKAKPALFFDPELARQVTCGNLEDDLGALEKCDLVIEAVTERLDIKRNLFAKVAPHLAPDCILASNTSGLSLADMAQGLPQSVAERFLVMHFFNPVRYMRLLEIVPGKATSQATLRRAVALGEALGKGVVFAKDTPNFIGNRIGTYGLMRMIRVMTSMGLAVEEVDKLMGKPMGRPASAAFRTIDIVGLDTFMHVAKNCFDNLPADEEREIFAPPDFMQKMAESGKLGAKAGAGFYKKVGADILAIDLATLDYRPQKKVRFDCLQAARGVEDTGQRVRQIVESEDPGGRFAWGALAPCLAYAARRIPEIADDVVNVDRALMWGFNWELGPFATWDAIGVAKGAERMAKDGIEVPEAVAAMLRAGRSSFYEGQADRPTFFDIGRRRAEPVPQSPRHIQLAALHVDAKRVIKDSLGASLVDLGDGALCLEVHTKMNTVDGDVVEAIFAGIELAERDFEALVVANDGAHFGAGANLMLVYLAAQEKKWDDISHTVTTLQAATQALRHARVPTVAAPFNLVLGGSLEISMACQAAQAHAESYMGLVEAGVGLVPAGGGCLRLVERFSDPVAGIEGVDLLPLIGQASLQIATAKVSTGAEEARRMRYLRADDGISLNRDQLLADAKARALGMARAGHRPAPAKVFRAAGYDAAKTIGIRVWTMVEGGHATPHDGLIANKVASILTGGNVGAGGELTEARVLELEREAFLSLCAEEKTQARMASILTTNKPLRN